MTTFQPSHYEDFEFDADADADAEMSTSDAIDRCSEGYSNNQDSFHGFMAYIPGTSGLSDRITLDGLIEASRPGVSRIDAPPSHMVARSAAIIDGFVPNLTTFALTTLPSGEKKRRDSRESYTESIDSFSGGHMSLSSQSSLFSRRQLKRDLMDATEGDSPGPKRDLDQIFTGRTMACQDEFMSNLTTYELGVEDEAQRRPTRKRSYDGTSLQLEAGNVPAGHKIRKSELHDPDSRRAKYLEKNRLAASKCRNKQKKRVEELMETAKEAESKNKVLKAEIASLKADMLSLIEDIAKHSTCQDERLRRYVEREADRLVGYGKADCEYKNKARGKAGAAYGGAGPAPNMHAKGVRHIGGQKEVGKSGERD